MKSGLIDAGGLFLGCKQKYSRLRSLLSVKGFVICFYLGWSGSVLQIRTNIVEVGSKSWLLTCSSNITLSLPSYTVSALYRELNTRMFLQKGFKLIVAVKIKISEEWKIWRQKKLLDISALHIFSYVFLDYTCTITEKVYLSNVTSIALLKVFNESAFDGKKLQSEWKQYWHLLR